MLQITISLSEKTYYRLREYAEFEEGTLPERAARDILERFFAEAYERIDSIELLSDGDDGYNTLINPEYAEQLLTARNVEHEYGLQPGTVRGYIRNHPEMVESGEFTKLDGRTWGMRRIVAAKIWGDENI
jgi:hypothetical protein